METIDYFARADGIEGFKIDLIVWKRCEAFEDECCIHLSLK